MSVVVLLIIAGGVVAAGFLGAFSWAVLSGQYDDTCTPAVRVLLEDGTRVSSAMNNTEPDLSNTKGPDHVDTHR